MTIPRIRKLLIAAILTAGCSGSPELAPTPRATATSVASPAAKGEATPSPTRQAAASPSPAAQTAQSPKRPAAKTSSPATAEVEGDGGEFQARKQRMAESRRRGATAKADQRLVSAVLEKQKSISDTIQSRTFELGIQLLLEKGRYDDLESLGDHYRDSKERLATGQRKSTIFYYALKTPRVPNQGRWLPYQLFEWKAARPQSPHAQLACARLLLDVADGRWNGEFEKLEGPMAAAFAEPLIASRQCLEKAATLSPDSDVYALLIDQVRHEEGPVEEAESYLVKSDKADSDNYHGEAQFARLLNARGRDWHKAISIPTNAYFALGAYLENDVRVPPKEYLTYAQAAEKAYPKSALIKSQVAKQAMKARDFDLAAKKFAELGDRCEIYAWGSCEEFYKQRNQLEDRGYKVRTGAFFPLPETPSELRRLNWEDDLLIRQTAELYQREHYAELEAVAQIYRQKTARSPGYERKVSRLYAGMEDEFWTKGIEPWEDSVMAQRWKNLFPTSTMAAALAGRAAIAEAWEIRGSGYADSVSDKQHEGFTERLRVAHQYLREARDRKGLKDPELYQSAITAGMGLGLPRSEVAKILEEAKGVDKLAPQPYQAMANYLLPRWHGSPSELEAFLESIPVEVYPEVIPICAEDINPRDPKVKSRALKGVLARAQRHSNVETWSKVLLMAATVGDRQVGAQAISALQGRWSPNAIMNRSHYERLVAWSKGAPLE